MKRIQFAGTTLVLCGLLHLLSGARAAACATEDYFAPVDIAPVGEAQLAVLGSVGRRLLILDRSNGRTFCNISLPTEPSGMVIRGDTAYVTTGEPAGRVLAVDLIHGRITRTWRVGHWPVAPVLSADGRTLFMANRFENRVRLVDLATGDQRAVDVVREPVALALSPDGDRLFAANHLPQVRPFLDDENPWIAAEVSAIDTNRARVVATVELPNGSQGLRGMAVSPDGRFLAVTHILSNYTVPTIEIAGGAMNRNALSLIRTDTLELWGTAILDDPDRGAANPWDACFADDGSHLVLSHAGTHELSVIDFATLVDRVAAHRRIGNLFDDRSLEMMDGIRERISLGVNGPRAICLAGGTVYAAGYFSDNVAAVDLRPLEMDVRKIDETSLSPDAVDLPRQVWGHTVHSDSLRRRPDARLGEQYFNDATLCFRQWQSCATCHPDGRTDALYWDLLNDGIGNTKNTKSLVMAALTPPVMWRGVRADAGMAVLGGIRHIQFVTPSPGQAEAIEQYLLRMKIVPSPRLNADVLEPAKTEAASCAKCHYPGVPRGTLSQAAQRGKAIFEGRAGCAACHPHPHFTSLETVDAGLGTGVEYDVPSLVEAWRSAPYLHHGDALSLKETITDFNHLQMRGKTNRLTPAEQSDLIEYLQSL